MIEIYTAPDCQPCKASKRLLDRLGIAYRETPLSDDSRKTLRAQGYMQAPVIIAPTGEGWAGHQPDRIRTLTS